MGEGRAESCGNGGYDGRFWNRPWVILDDGLADMQRGGKGGGTQLTKARVEVVLPQRKMAGVMQDGYKQDKVASAIEANRFHDRSEQGSTTYDY